ncbi:carboxyl transferase domain-containing protein [Marinobacter sp. F3R11]|uniref:carboxyl transferase domain-containing protein n=1 Tax=Marinobacter sp. F3R11 TaxID=2267231 RepID=UPI000DE98C4E|nr:carboxyl transferase domain-containing protein [Marinobacter sp. F3R11]RBW48902.1 carbamoyl-phosphate synthase large subunit [Marinobacter sp. F3R11]
MKFNKLLIANRGEIAIRIARAAAEMGLETVAIYSEDDRNSLHLAYADQTVLLPGIGARAYLDIDAIVEVARKVSADALHPGYGFLSENADLARQCASSNITFIGPDPETLAMLGDKAAARTLAEHCEVPVVLGTKGRTSLAETRDFVGSLDSDVAVVIKAICGGGGRGMRIVLPGENLEEAYKACAREAAAAFGDDGLYVERLVRKARHIEVQVLGDGRGNAIHLWERECSLQRRNQKLVEVAPSPTLAATTREYLLDAALRMARHVNYAGLGTFEFLVDENGKDFFFIEANPRLQVEHTVTEEITGVDLVQSQIAVLGGASLADLNLTQAEIAEPNGYAIQCRVNMESMDADGTTRPSGGTLETFEPPSGPGLRVDTFGYRGYTTSPHFDSLLAKLIVHSRAADYKQAVRKAYRALCQFRVEGVKTNASFLQSLLCREDVAENCIYTRFVDDHMADLVVEGQQDHPQLFCSSGASGGVNQTEAIQEAPEGSESASAPMQGQLVTTLVGEGDSVAKGQTLAILEAMKMEHEIKAPVAGIIRGLPLAEGDYVNEGQAIAYIEPGDTGQDEEVTEQQIDLDYIRPDLAETMERHRLTLDEVRPDAVAKRHKLGMLTARENIDNICDSGSFIEYGALTFAAQRRRRSVDDLMRSTPADGLVAGLGAVNGQMFDEDQARCAVLAYDYTVLAGTQGTMNHKKTDRVLQVAEEQQLPVIFFAEGGGGRPGDTDNATKVAGLDQSSFLQYARMTALAPRIGIVSGRCFAGNAVFAGSSDLLIATRNASLGMAGPAMIEGGGLGVYSAEEVGPMSVQVANGVVDCLVEDEREAAKVARQIMSYFQGKLPEWTCADQRLLRSSIPENRLRSYDIRSLIRTLVDSNSYLELRPEFTPGMVTAFARIEGRPIGLIANDPRHLGGAICANGADKASRFMQLCDAYDVPLISLCDTPGFMVGPEAEKTGLVRHTTRMFVTAASLKIPVFSVVLRKGYGLGAMGMTAGSFHAPFFNVAWPTGEFGGMGLEGAVRLGYRNEIANAGDEAAQKAMFEKLVAEQYEKGKALSMAVSLEIDAVIDPADTRNWILRGLKSARKPGPRIGRRRPMVDTW